MGGTEKNRHKHTHRKNNELVSMRGRCSHERRNETTYSLVSIRERDYGRNAKEHREWNTLLRKGAEKKGPEVHYGM